MKVNRVIGFCGLPGSGKSTAIDAIRELGVIITMGDVIRNEAKKRGVETTDDNLGKIAKEMRENHGPKIVAEKCVELISDLNEEVIFIDGVRSFSEVNIFRKSWKFPLIAIILNDKSRFERLSERGRSDDPKKVDDLTERDERELGFGLEDVIKKADYKVSNDSTIEDLKRKVKKIVLAIIKNN